jgi:CPA2 family monovalent cation:H+ antiporter-2
MGVALGLLPVEGQNLILAGALITIALNAAFFAAIDPVQDYLRKHSALARKLESRDDPLAQLPWSTEERYLSGQVVLVGYGRVGRRIAAALMEHDVPFVVVEQNREVVQQLRENGIQAVSGNAAEPVVLVQAHIAKAEMLIIATPESFSVRQIVDIARTLNPAIEAVVRTHSDEEAELLEREGIGKIFMGEHELAAGMTKHVLARRGLFK